MGKYDNRMADMARLGTDKLDNDISQARPRTFVVEETDFPITSDDLMRRDNIKRLNNYSSNDGNTEIIICYIETQAVRPVLPCAFPRTNAHRPTHESIGHCFILYLIGSLKLVAVPLKMQGPFYCIGKWHGGNRGGMYNTIRCSASYQRTWSTELLISVEG
jgi:hypothetical protein